MTSENDAAQALENFADGPAQDAANTITQAYEIAGDRIAQSLERAASSGSLSFNAMAESILSDLARLAIQNFFTAPLEGLINGATASGGIGGANTPPVNVTMNLSGVSDASSFARSQGQVSAALARAVSRGQRYL